MILTLHTLKPAKKSRRKKLRVGRGNASGKGTTAGRGTKGQKARTGGRKNLKLKGLKQMLLSFPKTRGFKSTHPEVFAVRLETVAKSFKDGEKINLNALKKSGLIPKRAKMAKIVGGGIIDKKLNFVDIKSTATVKAAVIKAGGSFTQS
ncbi:50S ribosomal protein L15 [Patescibacteria group bacterium]|nr:50S ribosomal protein L15 [Patescibacteria group bacterium]MBU1907859.1 50S ribosomal protein L15 [Patescibacteria group bacterium]